MSEQKKKGNRSLHIAFAIAVLIGAIILLIATERAARPPDETAPPAEAPKTGSTTTPPTPSAASPSPGHASARPLVVEPGPTPTRAFFATPTAPPPPPEERSGLADALGSPQSDATQDITIVASLFAAYTDHFHELPIGTNAEITAALAGDNTRGLAVLPADHGSINARGELVDRWGTPLFFHQIGDGMMQIRSAGPDRRLYSEDDLVAPRAEAVATAPAP